jgi:hypothetical protein
MKKDCFLIQRFQSPVLFENRIKKYKRDTFVSKLVSNFKIFGFTLISIAKFWPFPEVLVDRQLTCVKVEYILGVTIHIPNLIG